VADFNGDDVPTSGSPKMVDWNLFEMTARPFPQSSATLPGRHLARAHPLVYFDSDGYADILYQTGANGTAFQYAHNNHDGTFTIEALSAHPSRG